MGGICGIVSANQNIVDGAASLTPMLRALGFGSSGESLSVVAGRAAIGARKIGNHLATVAETVVGGHHYSIAYFGSIYNLSNLVAESGSDSKVGMGLLRLYLDEDLAFLERLRGEFVLAAWNGREERLSLATDRFRVHPLLYAHDREKLVFASRMKSISACPSPVRMTVNPRAILDVMAVSAIPTPRTIFQEVRKLPPGHVLHYSKDEVHLSAYWDINFLKPDQASEQELTAQLKRHFSDSIGTRLQTEVGPSRIGTFLSGGIDSSTVTGVLKTLSKSEVHSFSIGFGEQRFDEMNFARIAARHFGVVHHEYTVTAQDTRDALPIVLESFDEPFANASAVPTYVCAKFAKDHGVDVLYAGDGGDELFGGNERYSEQRVFEYYDRIPSWLRGMVRPTVQGLAAATGLPLFEKGAKYIRRASVPLPQRLMTYGFFNVVPMQDLFTPAFLDSLGDARSPYESIERYYGQALAQNPLDRHLYLDLKFAISDNDLFKVTRMTEAAGVTVRFPFLDHRLAEFAATVPARLKMRGRELRTFFKAAYSDVLPLAIRTKTKHGFGLPIPVWLRTDPYLNELMRELVLSARSLQRGYFRKSMLEELVRRHQTDQTSFYGTVLWNVMILELWHRTHWDAKS